MAALTEAFHGGSASHRRRLAIGRVDCIFCSIITSAAPSWQVYEDDDAVAFLDIGQATAGHTLVVPRRHAADIWSLSEEEAATVMRAVHRVARQLCDTLRPQGLNVTQSNGATAWQEVFHYHVHLVPRYGNDDWFRPGARRAAERARRGSPEDHTRMTSGAGVSTKTGDPRETRRSGAWWAVEDSNL